MWKHCVHCRCGKIRVALAAIVGRFRVFGHGHGPEIPERKGRVDVYETVNNLDKRAQPSSTAPAFCYSVLEPVKTANRCGHVPDAKQPAAREAFQLTLTENVCFQRNGLGVLPSPGNPAAQAPSPTQPRARLHKDCRPCGLFRGENCERQVTTWLPPEMPTMTPGPGMRCSRKSMNPLTEADKEGE